MQEFWHERRRCMVPRLWPYRGRHFLAGGGFHPIPPPLYSVNGYAIVNSVNIFKSSFWMLMINTFIFSFGLIVISANIIFIENNQTMIENIINQNQARKQQKSEVCIQFL